MCSVLVRGCVFSCKGLCLCCLRGVVIFPEVFFLKAVVFFCVRGAVFFSCQGLCLSFFLPRFLCFFFLPRRLCFFFLDKGSCFFFRAEGLSFFLANGSSLFPAKVLCLCLAKGSKEYFVETTGKIRGTVRKVRHTSRLDSKPGVSI